MNKPRSALLIIILISVIFFSCASMNNGIMRVIEGTGRAISPNAALSGGSKFNGGFSYDENSGTLYYSQSFYRGWLEFSADFSKDEGFLSIQKGIIKREDTILRGDEAGRALEARRERIDALVNWMEKSIYSKTFENQKDFEDYWRPVLIPETVKKKKRPENYNSALQNPEYNYAEGIKWNKAYTAFLFNDDAELSKLRDLGAIKRDFDEAALWIFLQAGRKVI